MSPTTASLKPVPPKSTSAEQHIASPTRNKSYVAELSQTPQEFDDDDDWMDTMEFIVAAPTYMSSPRSPSPMDTEPIGDR